MDSPKQLSKRAILSYRRYVNHLAECVDSCGLSVSEIARLSGIRESNIYRLLRLQAIPSAVTLLKVDFAITELLHKSYLENFVSDSENLPF